MKTRHKPHEFGTSRSGTRLEVSAGVDTDELNGRTVLLVDDEAFFLSSVVEGLHAFAPGLEVLTAPDGIAALEHIDRLPIDIVLTDIHMPRLDGFGLIAELINRRSDVNVVVLTAYDRPALPECEHATIDCLEKPLDFEQLLSTLIGIIRQRAHSQMRGVALIGLLQMLELERGDAAIRVQHEAIVAWIYIHAGRIVHATSGAGAGRSAAVAALHWPHPRLEVHLLPRGSPRSLDVSITAVILEAARHSVDFSSPLNLPTPADPPQQVAVTRDISRKEHTMSNIKESLQKANDLSGTLGIALVDYASGMTLGTHGSGINLDVAAAGNMNVMRAKQNVMNELGIKGGIEDVLITLDSQYHLIRPVGKSMFLYIALDRKSGNLALARLKLAKIAEELEVD